MDPSVWSTYLTGKLNLSSLNVWFSDIVVHVIFLLVVQFLVVSMATCLISIHIRSFSVIYIYFVDSALEPASLRQAIWPSLISYSSPDVEAEVHQSLSRTVFTSESPIFLLDAYKDLLVYYSPTASSKIPFPPPRDCEFSIIPFIHHTPHLVIIQPMCILKMKYVDRSTEINNW